MGKTGRYTAKLFLSKDESEDCVGDDVDELYTWMLVQAEGQFGSASGEIIDNKTNKVVRQFRKAPPD